MSIEAIYNREVFFIHKEESVRRAAELMRHHHIGDLVVVEDNGIRKPAGIVTDRDIVIEVIAAGIDPEKLTVKDVMGGEIVTAFETDDEYETIQEMHRSGVRRVPVINKENGALVGILTMDDLLEHIAGQLNQLAAVASTQRARESHLRE